MTRLFSIIAIIIVASVAGAQPASDMKPIASKQQPEVGPTGLCQANVTLVDEPEVLGGGGAPLQINLIAGAGLTPARLAVFQQAINEWQAVVRASGATPNPYSVTFQFGDLGGPPGCMGGVPLAAANTEVDGPIGNLRRSTITFNTNACVTFFEDPTPGDNCEFTPGCCVPPACQPPPAASFDLLTVARHELGHALGWVGTRSRRVAFLLEGNAFNPPRLNIPTVSNGCGTDANCHSDPDPTWLPNELMQPGIGQVQRRPISLYPGASMPARAFEYGIPMQFVDPTHAGEEVGTALRPWRTFLNACAFSPLGTPLLLSNATHTVPGFFLCANSHVVNAARGGAVVRP